jgi:hypothetical protein
VTSAGRLRDAATAFPYLKAAIVLGGALYLYIAAVTISQAQGDLGNISWSKVVVFALAPICIFCAVRYPVVFPLGGYIALSPFDALFSVSGAASLVRIIGFAALAAMSLRMLRLRKVNVPHRSWYFWLALVAYCALTLLWSVALDDSIKKLSSVFMLFVMMTLLATYPVTAREFKTILAIFVLSSVGAGIFAFNQFIHGAVSFSGNNRLDLSHNGFTIDVNYLGGSFVAPMAFAFAGMFYGKQLWLRVACTIAALIFIAGVSVNGSREALCGVVAIFLYFVVRGKNRLTTLALGGLSLCSLAFFPNILNRLFEPSVADGSGRTEIWRTGMHSFSDHWLLGSGLDAFPTIYDQNLLQTYMRNFPGWHRPGHSIVFESLIDLGIVGGLLVAACWYTSFRQLSIIPKTSGFYGIRLACEGAIIGLAISAVFLDPLNIKFVWFMHSLVLMALNVYNPRPIGFGKHDAPPMPAFVRPHAYRGG